MIRQVVILSALLVPALAFADQHEGKKQGESTAAQEAGSEAASMESQRAEAQEESIQGQVAAVDLEKGELSVRQEGESVTVHGTPRQLREYKEGDDVTVQVKRFGDNRWVMALPAETELQEGAAFGGKAEGRVESVDADKGEVTLSGGDVDTLKGHPQTLESLQPGQLVSISYEKVKDTNWIRTVDDQREDKKAREIQEAEQTPPSSPEEPPAP